MDVEQMTLEQQHQPKGENWEVKYNALKKDFDYIQTVLDEQSSLNVELSNQVKKLEKKLSGCNSALLKLEIKFRAINSICKVTGETQLTHAQRRALAWVQQSILSEVTKEEGAADPIPFNFYDQF